MKPRVFGCSGRELRTTPLLLDHDTPSDAGAGVSELSINEFSRIDRIFEF